MTQPKLIGIGGTNASGKDSLAQYLVDEYGYLFVSISDMIREVAMQQEGNILRPTLFAVANKLRAEKGAGIFVELAVEKFKKSGNATGLITSSIRTRGEIESLKSSGAILLFIDADQKLRYDRITSRQRADDAITFDEFAKQEQAEWHQSDNPAEFSIRSVKEAADYSFMNAGDIDAFYNDVAEKLGLNKT